MGPVPSIWTLFPWGAGGASARGLWAADRLWADRQQAAAPRWTGGPLGARHWAFLQVELWATGYRLAVATYSKLLAVQLQTLLFNPVQKPQLGP